MLYLLAPGGSALPGDLEWMAVGWSWGFGFEGGENGSRNSRERKGWQNKDLKLKCDVKKKEEMSSLGAGNVGRGWGTLLAPLAQKLPEG